MEPFFSASEMASFGEIVSSGYLTDVLIFRRTQVAPASPSVDYGDDDLTFPQVTRPDPANPYAGRRVKGWAWQQLTPVQVIDASQIVTVNTFRMFFPLGTDVRVGDELEIYGDDGQLVRDSTGEPLRYTVSDTNNEITWRAWLAISARLLE